VSAVAELPARIAPTVTRRARRRLPILVGFSFLVLAVVLVCAIFGEAIAPGDPHEQRLLVGDKPPSAEFWAGTDLLGRDVLSRVIVGARTALMGPIAVAVTAFAVATLLGLLSGYLGGFVDSAIMRWADFMLALPGPLVAIVVVGIIGGGYWMAVLVLVVLFMAPDTRICAAPCCRCARCRTSTRRARWASPRRAYWPCTSCPTCCRSCWPMWCSTSPSR
jgi:ABC-type dipeptide/oligopeptide/nickel transport system permease subunit